MDTEELRVLIHTVADTTGAAQTNAALRTVNAQGEQANTSLRRAGQSAREAGQSFGQGAENITRFVGALTGVELGLSLFTSAGEKIRDVLRGSIEAQSDAERTTRATAAAYGAAAGQYQAFATALSQQTGFTSQSILEAALSARTLSQNYGLTVQQTQRLIAVSADLARVRGIGVAESFERIQSAIRGEAEASEFLGLTLNATFLQQNAANGAYRQTFTTLTDAQRAQVVYNEVLRQSAQFSGLAAQAALGLDGAMGQASLSTHNLSVALGQLIEPAVLTNLQAATTVALALQAGLRGIAEAQRNVPQVQFGDVAKAAAQVVPVLGSVISITDLAASGLNKLAEDERNRIAQLQNTALVTRQIESDAEDIRSQLASAFVSTRTVSGFNEALRITHTTLQQVAQDINDLGTRGAALSTVLGALSQTNIAGRASVGAQQALQQIDAQILANRSLLAIEREVSQLRESTKILDPRDVAGATAARQRLAVLERLLPLEQQLLQAQDAQREIGQSLAQSQAQQAQIELTLLPARQQIAQIDRQINSAAVERLRLERERSLIEAQQRAAPATQALEDIQFQIERNEMVASMRGVEVETRRALRQQTRDLSRQLPGAELGALDARRDLTLAQRTAGAGDLTEQLRQNQLRQQQTTIRQAIEPAEARVIALQGQQEQLNLLGRIAEAATTGLKDQLQKLIDATASPTQVNLRIEMTDSSGAIIGVFQQLIEANTQAQLPPIVQQSGVRRAA